MTRKLPDRVKVKARVTIELQADVSDVWGGDCLMSQVYAQAITSAMELIRKASFPVTVVGEPRVVAILVDAGGPT